MNSHPALDEILSLDPQATEAAIRGEFSALCKNRPLVFFGAGPLGRTTLAAVQEAGVLPVAFSDNNRERWGQEIEGILVLSPDEAVAQYGRDAAFVVTIYNPSATIAQLRAAGCECVVGASVLWRGNLSAMGAHCSFASPDVIFEEDENVRLAFDLWEDDKSRQEFLDQLRWRTTPGLSLPAPSPPGETYFPPEIVLRDDDVFVDCGAFDGDTLRMVLARRKDNFSRFIGFEPDPDNFARLQKFVDSLPEAQRHKIICHNAATGASSGIVRFHATGTARSGMSGEGEIEMNCVRLDEALKNEAPTFIKMDIEGAEPDALEGARQTFEVYSPTAAICVYHASDHLWRIPLLLRSMCPDSKIYLRRYAEECWELVVYAVPSQR